MNRGTPLRVLGSLLVFVGASSCGDDGERAEPREQPTPTAAGRGLFAPWHAVEAPYPFPQDGEWFFRDLLAVPPRSVGGLTHEPESDARLRRAAGEAAVLGPVRGESVLDAHFEDARRSPATLSDLLEHDERDVRYAGARWLVRVADSLRLAALEGEAVQDSANALAAVAGRHLRDEAEEVALLALEAFSRCPVEWTTLRLAKVFGKFDNEPPVVMRARASVELIRRGCYGGWPLLVKILKEQTRLQDDAGREWAISERTAWWKEEAMRGIRLVAGQDFGFSPDASPGVQADSVERMLSWWQQHRVSVWESAAPLDDPLLREHLERVVLALGTFQLRNVDNAEFLLTTLGPPLAPLLLECIPPGAASTQIRRHCIEILGTWMELVGESTRRQWVTELTGPSQEADARIRIRALDAIGASLLPETVPVLEHELRSGGPEAMEVALFRLADNPSPTARTVLKTFHSELRPDQDAWLPATAALLKRGEAQLLEPYLGVLRENSRRSARASLYVAWFVPADRLAGALGEEARERAIEELRETYLAR